MKQVNISSTRKLDPCPALNLLWRPVCSCHIPLTKPRYSEIEDGPFSTLLRFSPASPRLPAFPSISLNACIKASFLERTKDACFLLSTSLTSLVLNKHHPSHNCVIYTFHLGMCADPGTECRLSSLRE